MLDQFGRSIYDSSGPFLPSPNVNMYTQFVPTKIAGFSSPAPINRFPKAPKPPEKPIMPYMRYSKKVWDSVKADNPDLKLWEIGKKIGLKWREIGPAEKQIYIDEYEAEKAEYAEAYRNYQNSAAYQHYLGAREKAAQDEKEAKLRVALDGKIESRVTLPPCEFDEEDLEYFSVRQLSGARYQRNHKLMQEVFSDNVMPDTRSVVTSQRLQGWKRQVKTLMLHQQKLESELIDLENKFQSKKRLIEDKSKNFQQEINNLKRPALDKESFLSLVASEEQKLLAQYQSYLQRIEQIKEVDKIQLMPNITNSRNFDTSMCVGGQNAENTDNLLSENPTTKMYSAHLENNSIAKKNDQTEMSDFQKSADVSEANGADDIPLANGISLDATINSGSST